MSAKKLSLPRNETNVFVHHLTSLLIAYCKSREERLSRKTAELIVRIQLFNSDWKQKLKNGASKSEIQNFIRDCFHFFCDENNISSMSIKMQCLFYGKYLTRDQFKVHKKEVVMKNCNHLLQKLKKVWHNPTEDFSDMHDDLVKFILIKEGMDDKEDDCAFDEIKSAVTSVFPTSEFSTFVINSQKIKTAFINEVSSIACGIRLYEWYKNKAGKFMFNIVEIMKETLPKVSEDIHENASKVREMIESLQAELKEKITETGDGSELQFKKQLLINATNYYLFLKTLRENVDEIASETYRLDYKFTVCIRELNSSLKSGSFSKADKLYPYYKEIGQSWNSLQLEGHLLDFYTNLFLELKKIHKHVLKIPSVSEKDIKEIKLNEICESEEKTILLTPDNVKNFADITLQLQGFCAYYCSMGILVPSIKELGMVMYKNSSYGFSSNKAMSYFEKQPHICVELMQRYMKALPELIISLGKEESFGLPAINTLKQKEILPVFASERSTQTVLHSIEENIDYTYNWNQWSLRKEAIKYADLLNKKTHSTQTDLSHFRRENYSQVYLPKDNWTQTRRDTGTSMSRTGVPELYRKVKKSFL